MRILIVSDRYPPDVVGGYELRCQEAVEWLVQLGHDVAVLTTESGVEDDSYDYHVYRVLKKYSYGATPKNWGFFRRLYFAVRDNYIFKRIVKKYKPDILYLWHCAGISRSLIPELFDLAIPTHVDVSDKWVYKVSREWGPIYGFLSGTSSSTLKKFIKRCLLKILPIFSFGLLRASYSIDLKRVKGYFTSRWNKEFHVKNLNQCEHFQIFHTGISLEKFPFKQKMSMDGAVSLLYVGQISREKGFFLLLDNIDQACHHTAWQITLTVVGDFRSEKTKRMVQKRIKTFNEKCKICFVGRIAQHDLYEYYHDSHFTVFPSLLDEALSRVPLESMACGTPCISTDNPGSKELFNAEAPLLQLDRKDPNSLWKTIREYHDSTKKYIQLSVSGKEFTSRYYTFDRYMENVEKLMLEQEMRKE